MPPRALLLIIAAAFAHSTWNLLAKRASHHANLIWFASLAESLLFLPAALWLVLSDPEVLTGKAIAFLLATGVLHIFYTEFLVRGYRTGDLSLVYPVARGTGPLISFFGALLLFGEHPSVLSVLGAAGVTTGIFLTTGGGARVSAGLGWGAATGFIVAAYTLVDSYAVRVLSLAPLLVEYSGNLFRAVVLSGNRKRWQPATRAELRACWPYALGIAILTPAGYVLVLYAMKIAPVSHVAPAREISMMIGAWFGVRLLGEGHLMRRLAGSLLIAAGVAALALG